jgi:surface antigen
MQIGNVATVAAVAMLGASVVGGCAAIEDKTGYGKRTQIAAAGGAVGGGVIAAVAGANTIWIIASAVLGGVAGGVVSELLGDDEAQQNAETGLDALENEPPGGKTDWQNPATGNGGTTTVDESFVTADGRPCKRFTQTITADGRTGSVAGTACRSADGIWEILAS